MADIYSALKQKAITRFKDRKILSQKIRIRARALSTEEAIGNPESDDFPLQKGRERLMQADFLDSVGQAFTDRYGDFEGTLEEVFEMDLKNNFRRAVFVASLNALLRHMGHIDKTIHCRDQEPTKCAAELTRHLKDEHGIVKIALIGFQPRMVEALSQEFPLRVLGLDPENIGTTKFRTIIEHPENTHQVTEWADLLLVTGTTLVNGTIEHFLGSKQILFYGTTISGAAHLMGWNRFCDQAK